MSAGWIGFAAGLFIGAILGAGFVSLLVITRESDEQLERIHRELSVAHNKQEEP